MEETVQRSPEGVRGDCIGVQGAEAEAWGPARFKTTNSRVPSLTYRLTKGVDPCVRPGQGPFHCDPGILEDRVGISAALPDGEAGGEGVSPRSERRGSA